MPWRVEKDKESGKFCVVKKSDGKVVKCHPTRKEANSHIAALYVNEPSVAKKSVGYGMLKSLIEERVEELKACGANQAGGGGFRAGNTCARGGGGSGGAGEGPAPTKNKLHGNLDDTISSTRSIVDKKIQDGTITKTQGQALRSNAQRTMGTSLDSIHAELAPNTKIAFSGQVTPTKTALHDKLENTINGARNAIDQHFQAGLITASKASQMKSQMQKKLNQRLNEMRSKVVADLG